MKLLIAFILFLSSLNVNENNSLSSHLARNYIVYDSNIDEVLEGKDYQTSYSVASISKIMTAIIALESESLFDIVIVDEIINTIEGSSLYLSIGDKITLIDLVYGLILRSGNDAAVLIAKYIGKDVSNFVNIMNNKAKEIGMNNTLFSNPSGLDVFDKGNISSCYDMALLMDYCMENPLFEEIVNTKYYKSNIKGIWTNKNKLLHTYKYCVGGKTGYTKKARRTLITAGRKNYDSLIIVTFDCSNDFSFHKQIYEKYFEANQYVVFLDKGINYIDEYCIYSDKVIGLRIKKSITSGIKMYHINPISNTLNIKLISDNNLYVLDKEFPVSYSINYSR